MRNPKQFAFETKGYVVVKGLLSREEVNFYRNELQRLSATSTKNSWTFPDGLAQNEAFWPVIKHPNILATIKEIFGDRARFLQHNDLHVGFSSFTWHRDSVNRTFGKGGDWEETSAPYQLARVGIYMQEADNGFRLGLIPGSHRPDRHMNPEDQNKLNKALSKMGTITSVITRKDTLSKNADWIATEPGDAIFFDPRTVHTGSRFEGVKYSMFSAYGVPNIHFKRHVQYYRRLRDDLGYKDLDSRLVDVLKEVNLYESYPDRSIEVNDAYIPSKAFSFVAKQFK